jgi:hypothetical protein
MAKFWLAGATTLVTALAVGAVIFALVSSRSGVRLLPVDSPGGTLQRYLLALEKEDYPAAYQYLSNEMRARCSFDEFVRRSYWRVPGRESVTLDKTESFGDRTIVRTTVTRFDAAAPFDASEHEYDRTYQLKLEFGQWKLADSGGWCGPY